MKKLLLLAGVIIFLSASKILTAQESDTLYPVKNLWVRTWGGGEGQNPFIKFNISTVPRNAIVTLVRLHLYVTERALTWNNDVKFINVHNQSWDETATIDMLWDSLRSDTILQTLTFATSALSWAPSSDLSNIFLRDFDQNHSFCTILLKDPDDGTMGPGMTPRYSNDSLMLGNIVFGPTYVIFAPRGYSDQTKRPMLIVNYTPLDATSDSICIGATATLSATGAATYTWSDSQTGSSITVNPTATTTYTVTGTDGSSNTGTTQTVVKVFPLPNITANSPSINEGQSATLCASGGVSYTWTTAEAGSCITVSPTSTATYTVTGTDAKGCANTANSVVTVTPTGIKPLSNDIAGLNIYPNPANNKVNIIFNSESSKELIVKILNVSGQIIYSEKTYSFNGIYNKTIDVKRFSEGVYFVQIINSESILTRKLVLIK